MVSKTEDTFDYSKPNEALLTQRSNLLTKYDRYVVICPYDIEQGSKVLLINKLTPNWQAGKLNLVGGKVEEEESPVEAAIRECKEETGCTLHEAEESGKIQGNDFIVHVVVGNFYGQEPKSLTKEVVGIYPWPLVNEFDRGRLIPNLNVVIPFCLTGMQGWNVLMYNCQPFDYELKVRVA
jgi:8-oxo-dGTP pyrophosphatase MutT (NUDIX family)